MSKRKGKLFVVSAPSGTGKTTIIKNVLKKFPELIFSISATTRQKRFYEVDGKDYFFITEKEFLDKIKNDEFIEWEKFYDYYYGTLKSFIEQNLEAGKSVVLEVDVKGALNIKKYYPESVLIFITPPSIDELKNRLLKRKTENETDFEKRIARSKMELSFKDKFDYNVVNKNLSEANEQVYKIIENELER